MAELVILYRGPMVSVFAMGKDADHNQVLDFLDGLTGLSRQDEKALRYLFEIQGEIGEIRNREKCRHLQNGIFEYKAGLVF